MVCLYVVLSIFVLFSSATTPPQPSACNNYTELSDAWRHIDYVSRGKFRVHCDQSDSNSFWGSTSNHAWGFWFRFTGSAGTKLPTAPAPDDVLLGYGNQICGTNAVAYVYSGGNPTRKDGIVTRDVCFELGRRGCQFETTVKVAACRDIHGDYFVYQLQPVPWCYLAYCAID